MADREQLVTLTADIVSAHVSNNSVAVGDVANLVQRVHEALAGLGAENASLEPNKPTPAMTARVSVKPDSIGCMVCGKRQKLLKRHIANDHDMTPAQYRQEFGLPESYPMVAPAYAESRREMAVKIGLGSKGRRKGTGNRKAG